MTYEIKRNKVGDITSISSFKVHPAANILPLDENLISLMASIKSTGLLHPIVMYKGSIIDGRRRAMACLNLDIIPAINDIGTSKELTDKEINEIVIAESTRRDLSPAQRAIIAAKQTISGDHKLLGYANAKEYAKIVWEVSDKTLANAKWLVSNHKEYADQIFEYRSVVLGDTKWTGVAGLVKMLKQKQIEEAAEPKEGNPDIAKAHKIAEAVAAGIVASSHDVTTYRLIIEKLMSADTFGEK